MEEKFLFIKVVSGDINGFLNRKWWVMGFLSCQSSDGGVVFKWLLEKTTMSNWREQKGYFV